MEQSNEPSTKRARHCVTTDDVLISSSLSSPAVAHSDCLQPVQFSSTLDDLETAMNSNSSPQNKTDLLGYQDCAPLSQSSEEHRTTLKLNGQEIANTLHLALMEVVRDTRDAVRVIITGENAPLDLAPTSVQFVIEFDICEIRIMAQYGKNNPEEVITVCYGDQQDNTTEADTFLTSTHSNCDTQPLQCLVTQITVDWFHRSVWKRIPETSGFKEAAIYSIIKTSNGEEKSIPFFDLVEAKWLSRVPDI
jgi:hypothetical protein